MPWYNPADPTQRNWMLGGIMCLLVVIPFRMYVLAPRQVENAEVLTRVEGLEEQNRRAGVLSARGGQAELEERMALYERHVAKLEELVPGQDEVAILIDDVQEQARLVDVVPLTLLPEPPEPQEFYTKQAFDVSFVGEYHSIARFLTEIANLSRIVTPVQLDLQLYQQPAQYPDMESPVIATFRIETYVLPDPNAQPQPAAAEVGA